MPKTTGGSGGGVKKVGYMQQSKLSSTRNGSGAAKRKAPTFLIAPASGDRVLVGGKSARTRNKKY